MLLWYVLLQSTFPVSPCLISLFSLLMADNKLHHWWAGDGLSPMWNLLFKFTGFTHLSLTVIFLFYVLWPGFSRKAAEAAICTKTAETKQNSRSFVLCCCRIPCIVLAFVGAGATAHEHHACTAPKLWTECKLLVHAGDLLLRSYSIAPYISPEAPPVIRQTWGAY